MYMDKKRLPFNESAISCTNAESVSNAVAISRSDSAMSCASESSYSNLLERHNREVESAATKHYENGMQSDTKCKIVYEDGKISVLKHLSTHITRHICIMSDIKSIKVYNDKHGNQKSMTMAFNNGVSVTASVDDMDVFSMDQGITICLLKYMLNRASEGCETSIYNKLVKHANRVYENGVREEEAAKEEAKRLEAKHKKLAAKKQRRKAKKREYEIELRKEAYIRAMNEMQNKPL